LDGVGGREKILNNGPRHKIQFNKLVELCLLARSTPLSSIDCTKKYYLYSLKMVIFVGFKKGMC